MSLDQQNNNIARASRFSAVLYDCDVKPPNFMFFRGREHIATWSEILAGNSFIVCDLEEVEESMRSWEQNPFISYEYESLWPP